MAHPFFDALVFPIERRDAQEFLSDLARAVNDASDLYARSGGNALRGLTPNRPPEEAWREALNNLTLGSRLRDFCRLLIASPHYAALHARAQAIIDATADGSSPLSGQSSRSTVNGATPEQAISGSAAGPVSSLNGSQLEELCDLIDDAVDLDELTRLVRFRLNERIENISSLSAPKRAIIFKVIGWAEQRGQRTVETLLCGIVESRPGVPALHQFYRRLFPGAVPS